LEQGGNVAGEFSKGNFRKRPLTKSPTGDPIVVKDDHLVSGKPRIGL
jgi:hypothetical protein